MSDHDPRSVKELRINNESVRNHIHNYVHKNVHVYPHMFHPLQTLVCQDSC